MKFGTRSLKNLYSCDQDMVLIHQTAIEDIRIDYGIHCGARTFDDQLDYFKRGKSTIDPRVSIKNAKHVTTTDRPKSLATDIHISTKYKEKPLTWQKDHLIYVASYLIATADRLFAEGKITHRLRWGGNWDMDGVIILDQNFDDFPHLELINP